MFHISPHYICSLRYLITIMWYSLCLLFIFTTYSTANSITTSCLNSICKVESGCRAIGCTLNGNSYSCGFFQINRSYWMNCKTPGLSWEICASDYKCASNCVRAYTRRFIKHSGCRANCESYARIHNGGPGGCRHASTLRYWQKVQKIN